MKRELDISIISDVHLGTYSCHAKELLNYLQHIKVRTLILNGDFIDMWQFKRNYFPKEHIQIRKPAVENKRLVQNTVFCFFSIVSGLALCYL